MESSSRAGGACVLGEGFLQCRVEEAYPVQLAVLVTPNHGRECSNGDGLVEAVGGEVEHMPPS